MVAKIKGYIREIIFEQINIKKQNHNNPIKMKVFASALLAMGAASLRLAAIEDAAPRDQKVAGQNDDGHPVNAAG